MAEITGYKVEVRWKGSGKIEQIAIRDGFGCATRSAGDGWKL